MHLTHHLAFGREIAFFAWHVGPTDIRLRILERAVFTELVNVLLLSLGDVIVIIHLVIVGLSLALVNSVESHFRLVLNGWRASNLLLLSSTVRFGDRLLHHVGWALCLGTSYWLPSCFGLSAKVLDDDVLPTVHLRAWKHVRSRNLALLNHALWGVVHSFPRSLYLFESDFTRRLLHIGLKGVGHHGRWLKLVSVFLLYFLSIEDVWPSPLGVLTLPKSLVLLVMSFQIPALSRRYKLVHIYAKSLPKRFHFVLESR